MLCSDVGFAVRVFPLHTLKVRLPRSLTHSSLASADDAGDDATAAGEGGSSYRPVRLLPRDEWFFLQFESFYHPLSCYHVEVHWLTASGVHIEAWCRQLHKRAERLGIGLIRVPAHQNIETSGRIPSARHHRPHTARAGGRASEETVGRAASPRHPRSAGRRCTQSLASTTSECWQARSLSLPRGAPPPLCPDSLPLLLSLFPIVSARLCVQYHFVLDGVYEGSDVRPLCCPSQLPRLPLSPPPLPVVVVLSVVCLCVPRSRRSFLHVSGCCLLRTLSFGFLFLTQRSSVNAGGGAASPATSTSSATADVTANTFHAIVAECSHAIDEAMAAKEGTGNKEHSAAASRTDRR